MSNLEKKTELRDVREEMVTDDDDGPLYIDAKYKKEGFFRRIVDSGRGGRVEKHLRLGYSVVTDDTKIGKDTVKSNRGLDSAVRIHLGGSQEPMGILMEISLERYEARQVAKQKRADEQLASVSKSGIPTQTGEIIIGNNTFK